MGRESRPVSFITARERRRIVSAPNPLSRSQLCQQGVMSCFARAGAAMVVS